jgi:hypothetical protein
MQSWVSKTFYTFVSFHFLSKGVKGFFGDGQWEDAICVDHKSAGAPAYVSWRLWESRRLYTAHSTFQLLSFSATPFSKIDGSKCSTILLIN